ncbi:MAG: FadR/GntR family transcriptional regulator [Thermodesulfobacteriota bacterium]
MKLFSPVRSGKVSELIAQQIKSAILNGRMKAGDRLPPERDLVERFGASRVSVREALNSLEAAGLLTVKRGSGVFVAEISSKPMTDSLSSILKIQKTSMDKLTEARIIFEPAIARLAAERIAAEDFQQLDRNIKEASARVRANLPATPINIEFHSLIAKTTHNAVIALTMENMFNVWKEWFSELKGDPEERVEASRHSVLYHQRILQALRQKNSQKVYELMLKHTLQIGERFKKIKSREKKGRRGQDIRQPREES